jgi:SPP1 family predicted phage head-tail adaptor
MRSGALRQRVTVMAPGTPGAPDALGQPTLSPITVGTYWADVRPLSGRELAIAQQLRADLSHLVVMRRVGALDATMWLIFNGLQLNIGAVVDVDSRRRELNLYCTQPDAQDP